MSTSTRYLTPLTASGKPNLFVFLPLLQKPSVAPGPHTTAQSPIPDVFSASAGVGGPFCPCEFKLEWPCLLPETLLCHPPAPWSNHANHLRFLALNGYLMLLSLCVTLLVAWSVYSCHPVLSLLFPLQPPDKWYPLSLSSDIFFYDFSPSSR